MTAYGIFGDVEASPKLVTSGAQRSRGSTPPSHSGRRLLAHGRCPRRRHQDPRRDPRLGHRNEIYHRDRHADGELPAVHRSRPRLTVSASFMLDVVESMRSRRGWQDLGPGRRPDARTDVLRALAKAKDNGTEIRDLAEAGLTLILFKGDDPPPTIPKETPHHARPKKKPIATLTELGEYADDASDEETADPGADAPHRGRRGSRVSTPTSTPPGPSWASPCRSWPTPAPNPRGPRRRSPGGST